MAQKTKPELEKMIQLIEKCMFFSQNTTSVSLWKDYLAMLDLIDKTMEWSLDDKDARKKGVLDRALEAVGHYRLDSGCLWIEYINFEYKRNNKALVNLLCYMAMQTPLRTEESQFLLSKYEGILASWFEQIFQDIT